MSDESDDTSMAEVWFIAATVGVLDCVGEFLWRPPLDKYFWTLARWRGKETAAIETMDEQIAVFESLTIEEQVQQLEAAVTACERAAAEGTWRTPESLERSAGF